MDKPSSFHPIKTPNDKVMLGFNILIALVVLCTALFPIILLYVPQTDPKSTTSTNLTIIFSLFGAAVLAYVVFKYKNRWNKNTIMLVLYTIFTIILFTLLPSSILDKYAYLFLPFTVLIAIVLLSLIINEKHIPLFYNYEKVKFLVVMLCFISMLILFYNKNPGGYIEKYFGATLLITILLTVFGLLYIVTLFYGKTETGSSTGSPEISNLFGEMSAKNFTLLGIASAISFILFLILVTVGIITYPGGFFKQNTFSAAVIIICILMVGIIGILYFSKSLLTTTGAGAEPDRLSTINLIFRNALLLIFGLGFSGIMIAWFVTSLGNLSTTSGIVSFVLNLLLVVAVLSLVYKLFTGTPLFKVPIVKFIVNILFYIPCLVVNFIDGAVWLFGKAKGLGVGFKTGKTEPSTTTHWILLVLIILLFILYFSLPYIQKQVSKQGGKLLLNNPVSLTSQNTLASYQSLNGSTEYDYQYAISFWFNLDAVGPNTSSTANTFTSIMSYGGKPNVMFNAAQNTLMITMKNKDPTQKIISDVHDADGNLIVYRLEGVLLQKWNHLLINYNGGTLDIFYNGELVKTVTGVVPYMEYDSLNIGYENGVHGQICNLNYFDKNITLQQVYYLYNLVKDQTPPVSYNSKATIIKIPESTANNIYGGMEVSTKKVQEEATAIATGDSLAGTIENTLNPFQKQDFLSLRWYFAKNNDYVGSL